MLWAHSKRIPKTWFISKRNRCLIHWNLCKKSFIYCPISAYYRYLAVPYVVLYSLCCVHIIAVEDGHGLDEPKSNMDATFSMLCPCCVNILPDMIPSLGLPRQVNRHCPWLPWLADLCNMAKQRQSCYIAITLHDRGIWQACAHMATSQYKGDEYSIIDSEVGWQLH
jgi:hypothetical protein